MNTYETKLIETARDFPESDNLEVANIARIRTERANTKPINIGNNYIKVFDHFENGRPVFRWENWG